MWSSDMRCDPVNSKWFPTSKPFCAAGLSTYLSSRVLEDSTFQLVVSTRWLVLVKAADTTLLNEDLQEYMRRLTGVWRKTSCWWGTLWICEELCMRVYLRLPHRWASKDGPSMAAPAMTAECEWGVMSVGGTAAAARSGQQRRAVQRGLGAGADTEFHLCLRCWEYSHFWVETLSFYQAFGVCWFLSVELSAFAHSSS